MSGKVIYKQRDIVLTKFPFSNLMDFKVRPVLVLSKDSYNRKYADVIVCAVTSNLEESEYGHTITTASLEEGHLKLTSKIRVDAIANLSLRERKTSLPRCPSGEGQSLPLHACPRMVLPACRQTGRGY